MKKKILLFAATVLTLACLFVISVGAESITYEGQEIELVNNLGDPSWYTGTTAEKIKDKDSIVILKDAEGNMTAYPSYYVFRYLIDGSGVRIAWANDKGVDYSFVNEKTGKNYASGSMYYVELPNGITICTAANVWGKGKAEPNVVEFLIPDSVTNISYNAFSEMENCRKFTLSKNLKVIDEWAFYNSKDLETVVFPVDCALEKIAKGGFSGCSKLSYINLENCQNLKTLGDSAFSSCKAIDKLYLPNSIETIGYQAIYNLGEVELASNYLPSSLKTLGDHFLSDCQLKNEVLYFPEGFTSLSSRYHFIGSYVPETSLTLVFLGKMTTVNLYDTQLSNFINNGSKQPLKLVFAKNQFSDIAGAVVELVDFNGQNGFITQYADGSSPYKNQTGTLTVTFDNQSTWNGTQLGTDANGNMVYRVDPASEMIFCGGETIEISYSVRLNHTDKGWYRFHTTSKTYDVSAHIGAGVHYNSFVVTQEGNCGYDEIVATTCVICNQKGTEVMSSATGLHTCADDFNCESALICDVCEKTVKEAMSHSLATNIVYANGYLNDGTKTVVCENDGCVVCNVSERTEALFVCLGFSVSEDGRGDIVTAYRVSKNAVSEYEAINGISVKYGVFAVSQEKLGDLDIFGENGKVAQGVVNVDMTKHKYDVFVLKIVGFTDEQKDIKLAMGTYVAVGKGDDTEYSYLQLSAPKEGDKYSFVSYNELSAPK